MTSLCFVVLAVAVSLSKQVCALNVSNWMAPLNHTSATASGSPPVVVTNTYTSGGGANQTTPSGGGGSLQPYSFSRLCPLILTAFLLWCS